MRRISLADFPPDARIALIAERQMGVFSRQQVRECKFSDDQISYRIRTGRWEQLHTGVFRLTGSEIAWVQLVRAATLHPKQTVVASHRSAGRLWELPGCQSSIVEVTVPADAWYQRTGVLVHHKDLVSTDMTQLGGLPVTSPERTVFDLAGELSLKSLEEVVDHAVSRSMVSLSRMAKRIETRPSRGRNGIRAIRRVIAARSGMAAPESVLETRVLRMLQNGGLPQPTTQHWVKIKNKRFRLDFAYLDQKIAIEADGFTYHSGRSQWERDLTRGNLLAADGWTVFHITTTDLKNSTALIESIRSALNQHSHEESR